MKVEVSGDGLKFDPEVYQIVAEEVLKAQAQDLARAAKKSWPVREKNSQGSRDKFRVTISSGGGVVTASVENYAEYAGSIKTRSLGMVRNKLLFDPAVKSVTEIIKKINNGTKRKGE